MEAGIKKEIKESMKKRYHLLDSVRGFLLVLMIIYHTLFDITILGDGNFSVLNNVGYVFQQFIGWGFIFLSGMCRVIGKRHMRRGLLILAAAAVVSLVSYIFIPNHGINFGILVFMGSATLIMIPLEKLIKNVYAPFGFLLCMILFMLFKNVPHGNLGFEGLIFAEMPDFLYSNFATAYLGFPPTGFFSGDYYPLIPWFFLYLCGYFFFRYFETKAQFQKALSVKIPVFAFLGRHSLLIYLLHQPICFAAVYLFYVMF